MRYKTQTRRGKILPLLAVAAPMMFGIVGLVVDGGQLASQQRRLQQAVDSAATAAATVLRTGGSSAAATATAVDYVNVQNTLPTATVSVHIPPVTGEFIGQSGFVEVAANLDQTLGFFHVLDGVGQRGVGARSVAGTANATREAAIVVLDPVPASLSVASAADIFAVVNPNTLVAQLPLGGALSALGLGSLLNSTRTAVANLLTPMLSAVQSELTLPALPTLIAGLEVEGVGQLIVDGAILVNTQWGGVDENGQFTGANSPPPYGVACMPLLPTTRIKAHDLRVVGGVDVVNSYQPFNSGDATPLHANRLPVPDPFAALPVPSSAVDSINVSATVQGHKIAINVLSVQSVMQPLLGVLWPALKTVLEAALGTTFVTGPLQPGVYDSITVLSLGEVEFQPGVYVIRGKSPITQMSLAVIGGWIQADGVMFYVTDSAGFSAATGAPDATESSATAPGNVLSSTLPSILLAPLLPGSQISGISSAASPFNGMLIYQRRNDRRPIILAATHLVGGGQASGTIYSKWGHVSFVGGSGSYDLRFVCGTMRVITAFNTTLAPTTLLPAAQDVFLVE
jgi:Flp pilus assembly protein TadG